jgi:hypothetical protein
MKMEQTECSEMLAFKLWTLMNHPAESIQHSENGTSLKSRKKHALKRSAITLKLRTPLLWLTSEVALKLAHAGFRETTVCRSSSHMQVTRQMEMLMKRRW